MTDSPRTLADLLQPCLPEGPQNTSAMEWLRRWEAGGGKKLSTATVESRMSDMLAERDRGVRFFFSDPARTAILADVLSLDQPTREEVTRRAEEILARGGRRAPRTVLDLSTFPGDWASTEALFRAVKADLLEPHLLPMVMVVLEDQYDRLPRSFDDFGKALDVVKVASAEEGREVVEERSDGEIAVICGRVFQPCQRWLAIKLDGDKLLYGPADGLAQLRERGRLQVPPTVEHGAEELLDDPAAVPEIKLPQSALALRRMVDQVGDPGQCAALGKLEERIAIAQALGMKAAYTEKELQVATQRRERARIEREVAEAVGSLPKTCKGLPSRASQADLDSTRAKARRVGIEPTLLRVGDTVHLVTGERVAKSGHPRLKIHRIKRAPNALEQLLRAVESMTLDAWRDDPLLLATIARLAGGDPERRKLLLHARATVLLGAEPVPAEPERIEEWRGALARLVHGDPPAARLRADVRIPPTPWVGDRLSLAPFAFPDGRAFLPEVKEVPQLYWVPPLVTPLLDRAQQLTVFLSVQPDNIGFYSSSDVPVALVPVTRKIARSHERWQELAEASPWLGGDNRRAGELARDEGYLLPAGSETWKSQVVALGHVWPQADLELAAAWLVLRRALRSGEATRLHDGRVLLELGGGILAAIEARRHGVESDPLSVALTLPVENVERAIVAGSLTTKVDTHIAMTSWRGGLETRLGFAFPEGMLIRGAGAVFEIHFLAPPLMVATSGGHGGEIAVGASAGAAQAAAAQADADQAAMDDDD